MNMIHSENPDNPFSSDFELTELYSNSIIDQFCSVLINSIGGKDFLILVIGESQSGKTTMLSKLTSQIDLNVKPCQLKIRKSHDPSLNSHKHPAFLYKTNNSQVIIMDDAHELNATELEIILKNAWDSDKETNQLILFCEPRINTTIASLLKKMPKKTSVNKLYIPCFDLEQTESYLNHYLEVANLSDQFLFSDKDIKNIYKASKGIPGKINHAAQEVFSDINFLTKNSNQTKPKYFLLLALLIILLLLSIGTFFIFKEPKIIPASSSKKVVLNDSYKSITKKIKPFTNSDKAKTINPAQESDSKPYVTKQITIKKNKIKTETENKIVSQSPATEPPKVVAKNRKEKAHETITKLNIFQEKWILTQEPLFYTIQVMAAKEDDAIDRFLRLKINNQNKIAYYKMNSKTEIWYKFIFGKYKTLDKAKLAINNLPEKLKSIGPWPRQFSSIQYEINEFIKNNEAN